MGVEDAIDRILEPVRLEWAADAEFAEIENLANPKVWKEKKDGVEIPGVTEIISV